MSVAEIAATPIKGTWHPFATGVQAEPSQCSISAFSGNPVRPTAHTSFEATAVTERRLFGRLEPEGFGLGTMVQARPSQCSMRVVLLSEAKSSAWPTAHTSEEETAATP